MVHKEELVNASGEHKNLLNLSGPNSRPGSVICMGFEMINMMIISMNLCFDTTSVEVTVQFIRELRQHQQL